MKKLSALILAFILIFTFVACGAEDVKDLVSDVDKAVNGQDDSDENDNGNSSEDNNDDSEASDDNSADDNGDDEDPFEYSEDYINEHLKEYSITYEMTYYESGEEPIVQSITSAKNDKGYYFKVDETNSFLYIKNGDSYDMYLPDEDGGGFVKVDGIEISPEDLETTDSTFLGYMTVYSGYCDDLEKSGSEKLLGRDCTVYTYDGSFMGLSIKYEYYIDKETGICLKYFGEMSEDGEKSGYDFVCTEFKTSGVSLPAYK